MKPSRKRAPGNTEKPKLSRTTVIVVAMIAVVILAAAAYFLVFHPAGSDQKVNATSAGALYSQSVDLANAGNYPAALEAADKALLLNDTSYTALIQANRAGILVMLGENMQAVAAADAALAVQGNLTASHSIAWFNKGNALKNQVPPDLYRACKTRIDSGELIRRFHGRRYWD